VSAAHRTTSGGAYGVPLMKFTLIYDGDLPSAGNGHSRTKEKWQIRKALDPQLRELWQESEILRFAEKYRLVPTATSYFRLETHHSVADAPPDKQFAGPDMPRHPERLDLCAPVTRGGRTFLPLVRETFGLRCALKIKFLRKEEPGKLIQQGDIDNRLKTLFDALSVPEHPEQVDANDTSITDPIYCVVESDSLITGVDIETQKLLSHPNASKNEVRLVIDVDVRVAHTRNYSMVFLGD